MVMKRAAAGAQEEEQQQGLSERMFRSSPRRMEKSSSSWGWRREEAGGCSPGEQQQQGEEAGGCSLGEQHQQGEEEELQISVLVLVTRRSSKGIVDEGVEGLVVEMWSEVVMVARWRETDVQLPPAVKNHTDGGSSGRSSLLLSRRSWPLTTARIRKNDYGSGSAMPAAWPARSGA